MASSSCWLDCSDPFGLSALEDFLAQPGIRFLELCGALGDPGLELFVHPAHFLLDPFTLGDLLLQRRWARQPRAWGMSRTSSIAVGAEASAVIALTALTASTPDSRW